MRKDDSARASERARTGTRARIGVADELGGQLATERMRTSSSD
jgi:hypothetical protein